MGHANVYIRKENEGRWAALPDKSAWVNERLEESGAKELLFDRAKPAGPLTDKLVQGAWEGPIMRDKKKGKL